MKKQWKIILVLVAIAIILVIIIVTNNAFYKNNTSSVASNAPSATIAPTEYTAAPESPSPSSQPTVTESLEDLPNDPLVTYENNEIVYEYFDVIDDSTKIIKEEASGELPLSFVLDSVSQKLFDKPLADSPMQPLSIKQKGNSIYVDFRSDVLHTQLGSSGESTMLESIADGYLNNIEGVDAVYFSVEGKSYSSSHIEFPMDVPYKKK